MGLPDFSKHLQNRLGKRQRPLFVSLADDAEDHLFRVDRRYGQGDRLVDSQAIGIDQREAAAIDRFFERGNQAAAIFVAADIGQPLLAWLANFFLVNSAQS